MGNWDEYSGYGDSTPKPELDRDTYERMRWEWIRQQEEQLQIVPATEEKPKTPPPGPISDIMDIGERKPHTPRYH